MANNKRNNKRNIRGSIRAVKHPKLYESDIKKQVVISSGDLKAVIKPQCFTKDLQRILDLHKIEYAMEGRNCVRLIKEISGIALNRIINDDKDHVRIEFGQTASELDLKRERIGAWLDKNAIPHGEEGMIAW